MPSTVDIIPEYQALLTKLQSIAAAAATAGTSSGASQWVMPDKGDWNGDLSDYAGIAKLFSRQTSNQQFVDIVTGKTPGSQGDGETLQLMHDYMAIMQRAFLSRHTMGKARAYAHAATRKRAQGLPYGSFGLPALENVRRIIASGKTGT